MPEDIANLDDLDHVIALARHDPDAHVRASAMRLIVLHAENERIPYTVVIEAMAREGATVRIAILGVVGPASPPALRALVAPCLRDIDQAVRLEAFEALLRLRGTLDDIGAPIRAWFDRVDERELDLALARWKRFEDEPTIALTLGCACERR